MKIEIQRPELEALLTERMKTGAFQNIEDVIMHALETAPIPDPAPDVTRPLQTAADIVLSRMRTVPPEIMAAMPADGASQHDHYIYGWPKREL